jgi:hypothetical protein
MVRSWILRLAELLALILLSPLLLWSRLPLPEYTVFTAPSQWLSFLPGFTGVLLRRAWYRCTLRRCGGHLTVDWLAVIRTRETEIGERCILGVANWVGWVRLGDDVMTGSHVIFTSGGRQHSFDDVTRPMRQQHGQKRQVVVGNDVWIGAHSVVMADVSSGTVIGAGSIVTRQHPSMSVIVGNPARVLRKRGEAHKT